MLRPCLLKCTHLLDYETAKTLIRRNAPLCPLCREPFIERDVMLQSLPTLLSDINGAGMTIELKRTVDAEAYTQARYSDAN